MELAVNKTASLWRNFMPWVGEIQDRMGTGLLWVQIFLPGYFAAFESAVYVPIRDEITQRSSESLGQAHL